MFESTTTPEQSGASRTFITRIANKIVGGMIFGITIAVTVPYFIFVGLRAKMKKQGAKTAILEAQDKLLNLFNS